MAITNLYNFISLFKANEIAQFQGIDIVDRIEIAWNEICKLV